MKMPYSTRLSIVIPTFREVKYIGNLLLQLVSIGTPIEIIVVDGESLDGTVEVAKQFTDKVYVISERGIGKARNYGAYRAEGDIIIFLDADVQPSYDLIIKTLKAFEDQRVVGATCNIIPANPTPAEMAFFIFYNGLVRFFSFFKPHSRGEYLAVRNESFKKINGFAETLPCLEDHDLAIRLSRLGKFVFISDLFILESMRRIRKKGLLNVLKTWISNYFFFILFRRTLVKTWSVVR